jgi:hypothetical protein
LNSTIEEKLMQLNLQSLETKDCVFVNGSDLSPGSIILPNRYAAPKQVLSEAEITALSEAADHNKRIYKWILIKDWEDEIIVSYFLRCALRGNSLFVELTRSLLTPIDDQYRKIDQIPMPTLGYRYNWITGSILVAAFSVVGSLFNLLSMIKTYFSDLLDLAGKAHRKKINTDPTYSYGFEESLRSEISSRNYFHYYQKMDKEMYEKMCDRQILNAVVDFLDSRDIDTSDIKERQSSILNTGIIVNGGDVKAQSLAVGEGARSGILRRFARSKDRPVQQTQGGTA